jgi:hypothetical protein
MTKREAAEIETQNDLVKSVEHLLADVQDESLDSLRDGSQTVSRTLARFASILVVLSRQTKQESDKNLQMQKTIRNLTWALLVLTFLLAIPPVVGVIEKYIKTTPDNIPASHENQTQPN